ncbi:Homospermidine synthase [compost metagenome]
MTTPRRQPFAGRLVMIGYGSIGRGVLPLLLRHIELDPQQVLVVCPDQAARDAEREYGVRVESGALTAENFHQVLEPLLGSGDFLLNLSVQVSSQALLALCQTRGALYLDTCIEPWAGGYTDASQTPSERSNYAQRHAALALRAKPDSPTALLTHGANPGLVSHLLKQALENLARDLGDKAAPPASREDWARLAQRLGVRCIHIAEYDSQYSNRHREPDEFVNTWSVDGFIGEICQPAELGWGSHERGLPADGRRHAFGSQAAIYLQRPGGATQVYSWTPGAGPTLGWLITHSEAISIAEFLSLGEGAHPAYRPTVHYAYRPCDDAVLSLNELAARHWTPQSRQRLLFDDIAGGMDELGVLLMGHARGSYWYGSRLGIADARRLCPHNNATSLQVAAAVMAGVIWAMRNPARGILEPDDLPYREILELCAPYLGELGGFYSDWTPLAGRERLFAEPQLDHGDPWQFRNFRAS